MPNIDNILKLTALTIILSACQSNTIEQPQVTKITTLKANNIEQTTESENKISLNQIYKYEELANKTLMLINNSTDIADEKSIIITAHNCNLLITGQVKTKRT